MPAADKGYAPQLRPRAEVKAMQTECVTFRKKAVIAQRMAELLHANYYATPQEFPPIEELVAVRIPSMQPDASSESKRLLRGMLSMARQFNPPRSIVMAGDVMDAISDVDMIIFKAIYPRVNIIRAANASPSQRQA